MKKALFFIVFFASIAIYSSSQTNVLHLNLGSHNETSDPAYGVDYNSNYSTIKSKAMEVADSVSTNGAKWNMQVESNFIRACLQFENANTNPNDLMQLMDNFSHVEVDPHNHLDTISFQNPGFNPYNYADLNHLLDSCGLSTRTNVGGFIYKAQDWDTWDGNWTIWKNGLQGRTFPWVTWTPVVLWGGGTKNHVNDPQPLGVWHPGGPSTNTFLTNDPNQLLDLGNGCAWLIKDTTNPANLLAEINAFISNVNTTSADPNTFYTATIMFDFRYILTPGYTDKIAEVLRGIKPMVANGSVVWQTLTEKRADWLSSHNNTSDNFIMDCNTMTLGNQENKLEDENFVIYPNPTNSELNIEFFETSTLMKHIQITNYLGQKLYDFEIESNVDTLKIDLSSLPNGVYFLHLKGGELMSSKTIVKE